MSHIENKAKQLRAEAYKKLNPGGLFTFLFGGSSKIDEATEYYTRAGNLFKMAKNWLQAGLVFTDAAELNLKKSELLHAAGSYIEAANCFKKCDATKAIESYLKAINLYVDIGRFVTAAKQHQAVAEFLEEINDTLEAIFHYKQAADYFRQENNHAAANNCMIKVAEHAALQGSYHKAIKIFQEMACYDLSSSLLQNNAINYFFRAALCYLCSDLSILDEVLNRYINLYTPFRESRELHLIVNLKEHLEDGDEQAFTRMIKNYNNDFQLTNWHLTMLMRARGLIDYAPDLE